MYTEYVINPVKTKRGRKLYRLSVIIAGSFTFGYTARPIDLFKTIDAAREYALTNKDGVAIVHESY